MITFEEAASYMETVDVDALAHEQTLAASTLEARLAQLAKVYATIRPVLPLLTALPLPKTWRMALNLFFQTVEVVVPAAAPSFKAGRDLES